MKHFFVWTLAASYVILIRMSYFDTWDLCVNLFVKFGCAIYSELCYYAEVARTRIDLVVKCLIEDPGVMGSRLGREFVLF